MRSAYALISLCEKYGDGAVESVCQTLLALDCVDVKRISRMLKAWSRSIDVTARRANVAQLRLPIARSRFERNDADFHLRERRHDEQPADFSLELVSALRRLRLGRMIDTLPDLASRSPPRRACPSKSCSRSCSPTRSRGATRPPSTTASQRRSSIPDMCIERFDKNAKISLLIENSSTSCARCDSLQAHRHVVILGPVGVGKTFIAANTLGHLACRHRYDVRSACAPT